MRVNRMGLGMTMKMMRRKVDGLVVQEALQWRRWVLVSPLGAMVVRALEEVEELWWGQCSVFEADQGAEARRRSSRCP